MDGAANRPSWARVLMFLETLRRRKVWMEVTVILKDGEPVGVVRTVETKAIADLPQA